MRKFIAMIPIILVLTSCGKKTTHEYFENPFNNKPNDMRFVDLEDRVSTLETDLASNIASLELLSDLLADTQIQNHDMLLTLMIRINNLEASNVQILSDIVQVRGQSITRIIDPCGDSNGFDEVLVRIGSGQILAYFENGNSRHLSVIPTGSYVTTDGTNCNFEVTSSGLVLHSVNGTIISE